MSEKVKLENLHLAVANDGRVHAGIFAGGSKTRMIKHKDIHGEFLTCVVTRFSGKPPEMITSSNGTKYMVMVQEMKLATEEEKKIILPGSVIEKPPGLVKV